MEKQFAFIYFIRFMCDTAKWKETIAGKGCIQVIVTKWHGVLSLEYAHVPYFIFEK